MQKQIMMLIPVAPTEFNDSEYPCSHQTMLDESHSLTAARNPDQLPTLKG